MTYGSLVGRAPPCRDRKDQLTKGSFEACEGITAAPIAIDRLITTCHDE